MAALGPEFTPGAEIAFAYPFVREDFEQMDCDGPCLVSSWRPGTRVEEVWRTDNPGPEEYPRHESVADGIGEQIVTVVSVHKPGRYPTRVFYERRWKSPDGKVFGKGGLHCKTVSGLRALVRGFRHEYSLRQTTTDIPEKVEA